MRLEQENQYVVETHRPASGCLISFLPMSVRLRFGQLMSVDGQRDYMQGVGVIGLDREGVQRRAEEIRQKVEPKGCVVRIQKIR